MTSNSFKYCDDYGQIVNFSIPDGYNKILCDLSGGADSAILAWITIKYCEAHMPDAQLRFITLATPQKGWAHAKWANRVIDGLLNHTGTSIVTDHHVFYRPEQTIENLKEMEYEYANNGISNIILGATTQNPPSDVEHLQEGRSLYRDPGHALPELKYVTTESGLDMIRYRPFVNVDKRLTAHIYKEHDLGWLYKITRSCEQYVENNDNNMELHCGECWWCKERLWAFGDLEEI